ncbi:MAG TPA: peptidylprolyl isomerase [Planctomycetota bacterium]
MTALLLVLALQEKGVRLLLESPEAILRPERKMLLRFTIENAGDAEAKVDEPESWVEGLEAWDAQGKIVKGPGKTKGISRRSRALEPGGFLGRVVDVASAVPVAEDGEGYYRFRWSFGDLVSNEVRVLVLRDWIATLDTNHGALRLEFNPEAAPRHVLRFLDLSRRGFYDGTVFHRIIPGFMMQGGAPADPAKDPTPLEPEFNAAKHVFGTLSMARKADPASATCQFFICFGPAPNLDRQYTVFGRLLEGQDVVQAIEKVKSDHSPCKGCGQVPARPGGNACCGKHHADKPETDVVLKKVTLAVRKT